MADNTKIDLYLFNPGVWLDLKAVLRTRWTAWVPELNGPCVRVELKDGVKLTKTFTTGDDPVQFHQDFAATVAAAQGVHLPPTRY